MKSPTIRRALISVSSKLAIADFARALAAAGVQIYSTGGTRKHLESEKISVHDVSGYTNFPEMLEGRVKTLHPKIFAGILCRHDRPDDMETILEYGIHAFELVVVNLYPFEATVARPDVTREEAIEQIDIGGPSLVRAAAKNHAFVTIATDPAQYSAILDEISRDGKTSVDLRRRLAAEAFELTARYDRAIANYLGGHVPSEDFPSTLTLSLQLKESLRYGENPHQKAALYSDPDVRGANLVSARQLNGKELSYNNLLDLDSALALVRSLPEAGAVVIKHNNPCGAAMGVSLSEATRKALDGDPQSAFGSVLGLNRTVDVGTAKVLATPGLFIEAIVAPDYEAAAVEILTTKPKWKDNVRLMQVGRLEEATSPRHYRHIEGGLLLQDPDVDQDPEDAWQVVTEKQPASELLADLRFGWAIVRHVKSNAIVLAKDRMLCGAGAGQMSRVDSVDIALHKAGERARGSILASDAFFPFADSIHKAAEAGIAAIIQPGGSKRDDETIAACNQHGIPMIFTGRRHFKH